MGERPSKATFFFECDTILDLFVAKRGDMLPVDTFVLFKYI